MEQMDWFAPERMVTLPAGVFSSRNVTEALLEAMIAADDLGFLYRRSLDAPFCESRYGGLFHGDVSLTPQRRFPEWGAVVSSPFILFCGMHMTLAWRHESSLLHVISALFAINGIAAFLAHYSGWTAWHNIDEKSLLLAVWLGAGLLTIEMVENSFVFCGCRGRHASSVRHIVDGLVWVWNIALYFWITESNATLWNGNEAGKSIGAFATAVPLAAAALEMLLQSFCLSEEGADYPNRRAARCRFAFGVLLAALGCGRGSHAHRTRAHTTQHLSLHHACYPSRPATHHACLRHFTDTLLTLY